MFRKDAHDSMPSRRTGFLVSFAAAPSAQAPSSRAEGTQPVPRVEAVLPLALPDLERFLNILLPSLETFGDFLSKLWVVTAWRAADEIAQTCSGLKPHGFDLEVLSELTVVPELILGRKSSGWFRQQLVKLAIVDRISSDFFLSLDADVVCTRKCRVEDLIPDGRALLQREPVAAKPVWYGWSSKVLGVRVPRVGASVTPNMFSVEALRLLRTHLEERIPRPWLTGGRAVNRLGVPIRPWVAYLVRHLPWTEYSLYVTFLEAKGLTDRYHRSTEWLSGNNVWSRDQFELWDPEKSFGPEGQFLFSVIQSNTGIAPERVASLVRPHIDRTGPPFERDRRTAARPGHPAEDVSTRGSNTRRNHPGGSTPAAHESGAPGRST
jgi:uncharacterized protein DUF6492